MFDDSYPTMEELKTGQRLRKTLVMALVAVTVILVIGTMTAIAFFVPQTEPSTVLIAGLSVIVCIAVPTLVCYYPRAGVYFLFCSALLFPGTSVASIPTMPTSYVPFWWNLSTVGQVYVSTNALKALSFSPAEFLMVLTIVTWLIKTIVMREFKVTGGVFFGVIGAYTSMVAIGFLNGFTHSHNMTMALYEVRGQAYFFMIYLMTINIFDDKKQVKTLIWLIVLCTGFQGLCAAITYFSLNGTVTEEGFMSHDESLYLSLLIFIALLNTLLKSDKRLKWATLIALLPSIVGILGNQRRSGIAAVIVAFLPLLPMMYVISKEHKKKIIAIGVVTAVAWSIYLPIAWNATGAWALPARSIRSQTEPNSRDNASNAYRLDEEFDVKFTRDTSPFIGVGYGSPFLQPRPLAAVTTDFVYYMPHNSVLWVWMRLGHVGFLLYFLMVGVILIKGMHHLKVTRDPTLLLAGTLAIVLLLMVITFGKYDLALVNCRTMILLSIMVGILSLLPTLQAKEDAINAPKTKDPLEDEMDSANSSGPNYDLQM